MQEGLHIDDGVEIGENVTIFPPCYILGNSKIGDNCIIYPYSYIEDCTIGGGSKIYNNNFLKTSKIGKNCEIFPNNYIENSTIWENCDITSSHIVEARVKQGASVGPFARLRPQSDIGEDVKIGDFVEVKNSVISKSTKASHLAYIGDSKIGENCNIGCGAIFVNYNGREKNKTIVGDNCFIGSNCNIIAPVKIENNSYICAGTTVTEDTESGDFVIGRARQINKHNRAKDYLKEEK